MNRSYKAWLVFKSCYALIAVSGVLVMVTTCESRPPESKPSLTDVFAENSLFSDSRILKMHKRRRPDSQGYIDPKNSHLHLRTLPPAQASVDSGSSYVLQCEAGGNPPPKIHWLKNGRRIVHNSVIETNDALGKGDANSQSTLGLSFTRSKLFLDCVQPEDEGAYTCVAENPFSKVSAGTKLKVSSSSNDINPIVGDESGNSVVSCMESNLGLSPRIYMWTHARLEMIGAKVQLYCRHTGGPKTSLVWIGPKETPLVNGDKYSILKSGDLVISDLSWEDMGDYTCQVENPSGSDKISMFLYPTLPEN